MTRQRRKAPPKLDGEYTRQVTSQVRSMQAALIVDVGKTEPVSFPEAVADFTEAGEEKLGVIYALEGRPGEADIKTSLDYDGELMPFHLCGTGLWLIQNYQVGDKCVGRSGIQAGFVDTMHLFSWTGLLDVQFHNHRKYVLQYPSISDMDDAFHKGGKLHLVTSEGLLTYTADHLTNPEGSLIKPEVNPTHVAFEPDELRAFPGIALSQQLAAHKEVFGRMDFRVAGAKWADVTDEMFEGKGGDVIDDLSHPQAQVRLRAINKLDQLVAFDLPLEDVVGVKGEMLAVEQDPQAKAILHGDLERLARDYDEVYSKWEKAGDDVDLIGAGKLANNPEETNPDF